MSSPHTKANYDGWPDSKEERHWGIRKGRIGCLGSCICIKFEGKGNGTKVVVVVYCLRVCIDFHDLH